MAAELLYLAVGGLLGAVLFWFYKEKMISWSWPYMVPIISVKGGAKQWTIERARRFIDKRNPNIQKFRIKGMKKNIPAPEYKDVHIDKHGKNVLPLASMQEGQYFPLNVISECPKCDRELSPGLHVEDKDVAFFREVEAERVHTNYSTESFITKYMPLITAGILFAAIAFTVLYLGNTLSTMGSQASGNLAAANEVATKLTEAIKAMNVQPVTTPPLG